MDEVQKSKSAVYHRRAYPTRKMVTPMISTDKIDSDATSTTEASSESIFKTTPIAKPVRETPNEPLPSDSKHRQEVEKNLIDKAFWIVMGTLIIIAIVFLIGTFASPDGELVTELLRILSTMLMLALGFLFGTSRK